MSFSDDDQYPPATLRDFTTPKNSWARHTQVRKISLKEQEAADERKDVQRR